MKKQQPKQKRTNARLLTQSTKEISAIIEKELNPNRTPTKIHIIVSILLRDLHLSKNFNLVIPPFNIINSNNSRDNHYHNPY